MARRSVDTQLQTSVVLLSGTVIVCAIVAALYWAQVIFVPLALAVLLTFLLTPLVRLLERRGLSRAPAALIVVVMAVTVVGSVGWLITRETASLAKELPDYSANIKRKIQTVRHAAGGGFDRLGKMIEEIAETFQPHKEDAAAPAVVIRPEAGWLGRWPRFVGSAVEVLAGGALVLVLTIFGLFKREDLRNRFMRLMGHRRLAYTTKAVDEAGERVSRYLIAQAAVNAAYGIVLAIGLQLLGVKYAPLWGFMTALLRYVPYLGVWLSILFPLVISLATADGWTQPISILALFLAMEALTYNLVEPLVFKRSMGVSEVAQLVAAAFWGFLWGPVGLVLSAPLTVCLLVIGKYVPQFAFLDVLLGDDPPLEPAVSLYQRLLAWDEDDASDLVASQGKGKPAEEVYDGLLIPALSFAKRDRIRDEIDDNDDAFILRAIREMIDEASPTTPVAITDEKRVRLLSCPSFDESDVVALEMLQKTLNPNRWDVTVAPTDMLAAEVVGRAVAEQYDVICIGSVPPGGLSHCRYLCKRLRSQLPNAKIVVGRWGRKTNEENTDKLVEAGADSVAATLEATRNQLNAWLPVLAKNPSSSSPLATRDRSSNGEVRKAMAAT